MSIRALTAALELAPAAVTPTERLVLLALAWHSDEHGRNAWPAVGTLARKTSLTRRAVQKVLRRLAEKGLVVEQGLGSRGSVRYGVDLQVLDRERYSQSAVDDRERGSQSADLSDTATANVVQGGGERGSRGGANVVRPIRPLIRPKEEEPGDHAERSSQREEPGDRVHGRASRSAREIFQNTNQHDDPKTDDRADPGTGAADGWGLRPAASAPDCVAPPDPTEAETDDETDDPVLSIAELQAVAERLFDQLGDDVAMDVLEPAFVAAARIRPGDPLTDHLGSFLFSIRRIRRRPLVSARRAGHEYGVR